MAAIIDLKEILSIIEDVDVVEAMEKGFIKYSNGETVVPPVAELLFDNPKGDTHIKYGYIKNDDFYCVKIASGFYNNPKLGIPSSQGLMLLFNQKTGQTVAILLDEGKLTDIRTAAAGVLAAKYFAPKKIKAVGIIGSGIQARLQLKYILKNHNIKTIWIWGIDDQQVLQFKSEISSDCDVHIATSIKQLAEHCNLIVTTTPSEKPLLAVEDVQPGTHITAIGSDTSAKQELDSQLLAKADIVIADSISQSKSRGEIYRATKVNAIKMDKIIELGKAIQDKTLQRINENQITIVDLTGVAVQDIMIATSVYEKYKLLKK